MSHKMRLLRWWPVKILLLPYIIWHARRLNRWYGGNGDTALLRWHWWRRQWEFSDGSLPPPINSNVPVDWRNCVRTYHL